jgi:hypothetical protein
VELEQVVGEEEREQARSAAQSAATPIATTLNQSKTPEWLFALRTS